MAYEGDVLNVCSLTNVDLTRVEVVAVSGSGPNVCGHLILYTPSRGGYYFHVAGQVYGPPRQMSEAGFRRYLKENGKRELRRIPLQLPDPRGAERYLERLMAHNWFWGVLPHNCVAFCEAVLKAGGAQWDSYSNCPAIATDVPAVTLGRFLQSLETQIYNAYGVPR